MKIICSAPPAWSSRARCGNDCSILRYVTTTERIGHAMIAVARNGYPNSILETEDINSVG